MLLAALAIVWGSWTFHYLCDDAYIAFRYARNAADGWGFVFNPPPFQPVEGYTSFVWVAVLAAIDVATGIQADRTAPVLSLICSLAVLPVLHKLIPDTRVLGIVLLGTVTNRTWLAWTTSGLETPLWTLALLGWVTLALRKHPSTLGLAALLPLIRPDGYLFALLTPALVRRRSRWLVLYAVPLLHLLWRFQTYGDWLPNTYAAKVVRPWPFMGAVYAGTFSYEYMLFPLFVLILTAGRRAPWHTIAVTGTLGLHLLTHLRWGGDHFEYRILVHWIPLIWLAAAQEWRPRFLMVSWAAGMFLPWLHFAHHNRIGFHVDGDAPVLSLSAEYPLFTPVIYPWERAQNKMQHHLVGVRHHLLRRFILAQQVWYRSIPELDDGLHILAIENPGWPGWVLPEVAIIDTLGLNDAVVARIPVQPDAKRRMAHDRRVPPEYLACFEPDLHLTHEIDRKPRVQLEHRPTAHTEEQIRACERIWWARVGLDVR